MSTPPSIRQCLELLAAKSKANGYERKCDLLRKKASSSDLTPQILDALATICAVNRGEVFAVAVEVTTEQVVLRVAGNNGVPSAVKEHLQQVWQILQDADQGPKQNTPGQSKPEVTPSPEHPHIAQSDPVRVLWQCIYLFSMKKLSRRVRKYGDETVESLKWWSSRNSRPWKDFDETWETLELINSLLKKDSSGQDLPASEKLLRYLPVLLQFIFQSIDSACIPKDAYSLSNTPWRGLLKILALHDAANTLFRITRSPTRERYLLKRLRIVCLNEEHIYYPLESSLPVRDLRDYFFPFGLDKFNERTATETLDKWMEAVVSQLGDGKTIQTTVHAECVMLLELRRLGIYDTGAYIGLSKLSCFACGQFFTAFNTVFCEWERGYRTKGSYGKMYPRWGDPCALPWTEADESLKDKVQLGFNKAIRDSLKQGLGWIVSRVREASYLRTDSCVKDSEERRRAVREALERIRRKCEEVALHEELVHYFFEAGELPSDDSSDDSSD